MGVRTVIAVYAAFAVVVGACVGDSATTPDGGPDAATDVVIEGPSDASASDASDAAASDAATCDLAKPFSTPTPVAGVPPFDTTGRLSVDELTYYFQLNDGGALESVSRPDLSTPFATPVSLSLTGAYPAPSHNQLTLVYGFDFNDGGLSDLLAATRTTIGSAFGSPNAIQSVNSAGNDRYPFLASDDELWFASTRTVANSDDLYRSTFTGSSYAAPVAVNELNTTDSESYPTLTGDKLRIFFTRYGSLTTPQRDIWTATRTSPTGTFSTPTPVVELNTSDDDRSAFVSPDGCRIYVSRGPSGTGNLFIGTRPL